MDTTPGTRLRYLRELLGYKGQQQDFADKVGLTQQSISNMERDKTEPANKSLNKIFAAFPQVNISWLVSGQGQPLSEARTLTPVAAPPAPTIAAEPAAPYACLAPATVVPLSRQLGEAHARILELETELKDERKQARQDLRLQATYYNSVKEEQSQLITRLYAKIDEYELRLGFRQPTAAERALMGGGEPRMEVKPFGERYRTELPTARKQATECVVREMYPAAEASHYEAA